MPGNVKQLKEIPGFLLTFACTLLLTTPTRSMELTELVEKEAVLDSDCVKIMELLRLNYHPVEISEADKAIAEKLRPIWLELNDFHNLQLDSTKKQERVRKFFATMSLLWTGQHDFDESLIRRLSRDFDQLSIENKFTSEQKKYADEIFGYFNKGKAIPQSVSKALIINAITTIDPTNYPQKRLETYSFVDLAEIINYLHDTEISKGQEMLMAITGVPWPELISRGSILPLIPAIIIYTATMLIMLAITDKSHNYALTYALPIVPTFFFLFLYSSYNYVAYCNSRHRPNLQKSSHYP